MRTPATDPRCEPPARPVPGARSAPCYVHTLHAELGPKGVYAGVLLIGALIEGSEAHRNASAWSAGGEQLAVVSADDLAGRYWDMYSQRDRIEEEVTPVAL
jgi:hypothetical protein